jgi:aryl-alcohol dehydrogenase-like predicted oxidoreductase
MTLILASAPQAIRLGGDLVVPRLGFGTMRLTGEGVWGPPADPASARRVLQRAVELGIRFFDTADSYGPGDSETLIAEALHPYPPDVVIATKGGIVRPEKPSWNRDGRASHLRKACEASLERLRVERIDLYQLHALDPRVPLEESVGELARLRQEGKVRHVGVSNFSVAELARARRIVEIVSVQNRYNVADRASDDVLAACERDGLAFIPWSPLVQSQNDAGSRARAALERKAKERGLNLPQAAVAWLLARSPAMLPIPCTTRLDHLEQLVTAAALSVIE